MKKSNYAPGYYNSSALVDEALGSVDVADDDTNQIRELAPQLRLPMFSTSAVSTRPAGGDHKKNAERIRSRQVLGVNDKEMNVFFAGASV